MNLDFTESQEMLRTSARDFLSKELPKTKVKQLEDAESDHDPALWAKMAEMGWLGLTLPEEYGGSAMEFTDLVILVQEAGRNVLPGPFFSTVCVCSEPILRFGTDAQKKEILSKVANGEMILTLALHEESASFSPIDVELRAAKQGSDYVLNGVKLFVSDAKVANCMLVVGRTTESWATPEEGVTIFLVDTNSAGVVMEEVKVTGFDRQYRVEFKNVKVSPANVLGEKDKGWPIVTAILERAAVLKGAEMAGCCEAVVEMTSTYAKERIQYERPIGHFQAVQHFLVNMWMNTEALKSILYYAAWKVDAGIPHAKEASIVKSWGNEAMKMVAERGVHLHGAIGMTRDHDVGLYYRRAWAWDHMFGSSRYHRDIVANQITA
jgi:alkylation response protein AidB-like acyl-CoA dehydrogenase